MSEQRNTRRALCEQFAPLLAALDFSETNTLADTAEMAEARAHLAGCPYCQADQRDYAALDGAVRSAYGPAAMAPFHTANLLAAIGATSEPQPRRAGDPIRSVRYLKDFDDTEGHTTMPDTEERAPNGAARPSVRPSRGAGFRRQALTLGVSATAAAIILVVVAVSLFGAHWRPTGAHLTHGTASAVSLPSGAAAAIVSISMDSPTDGWALGDATLNPTGVPTGVGVAFYHYDGQAWRLTQRIDGMSVYGTPARIQAFSFTNAWAIISGSQQTGDQLYHYDGTSWKPAPITITSGERLVQLEGFQMTAPTEGWAAAYLTGGAAGAGALAFLHYDGQRWTVEQNVYAPSGIDLRSIVITGFSTLPGVVWAVGYDNNSQQGYNPPIALTFHRLNGIWSGFQQLNAQAMGTAGNGALVTGVLSPSPNSVFAIGATSQATTQRDGSTMVDTAGRIWSYSAKNTPMGGWWSPVNVSLAAPYRVQEFTQAQATSDHDIWVAGLGAGATLYPSGFQSNALLLHYDGSSWIQVKPTVDIDKVGTGYITTIGLAPNGDLWAAGYFHSLTDGANVATQPLIWRYSNSKWSAATVVTK